MPTTDPAPTEWLSFPDEAEDAVAREALQAAWQALAPLRNDQAQDSDNSTRDAAAILAAFLAVRAVRQRAHQAFCAAHPDRQCHEPYLVDHHIVGTAVAFVDDLGTPPHPYSRAGAFVMAYARVSHALAALSDAEHLIEDSTSLSGEYCAPRLVRHMEARAHDRQG